MRSGGLRWRLFNMGTRVGRASEAASGVIVILALVTLVLHTVVTEGTAVDVWLGRAEIGFWGLFTVEYAMRIYSSDHPTKYLRSFYGIVDLLAVVAGLSAIEILGAGKPLRLLRALRVLKLARYSSAVDRFSEAFDDIKDELALFSGVTAVMTFIAAYGIWEFEHETNEAYGNLFDCVYWSVASLTMGAEGIAPTTVAGKVLAMLLVLIGLGIVAVPSGLFASALSKTGDPSP
ncbi:MAG: ion transporter [Acidimicrobiia bacterium]|nr:ion transporter [Acidimicrobiia bacterium]